MKPTLYEALGLSQAAAESEIKAALRRLVRRYYAKTRAGHADVEEALRFLNHASHILGNPARRAEYDAELAENIRTESTLTTIGGAAATQDATRATAVSDGGTSITLLGLPRDKPPPTIEFAPEWGAKLADIRRTRAGQLAGLLVVAFLFLLAWNLALPAGNAAPMLKFALVMLTGAVVLAAAVFAIVHLLSRSLWRPPAPEGAITLVEGMIPRWRRDRTVFMGTGAPIEDATWLFRLRMAELKRVSAERVSDPQPEMRLFARLFDYALWGMLLLGVPGWLVALGALPAATGSALAHPLVAPLWITASWIPVEALLLTHVQTTPGRWLLCVYLQHEVSNPYAPEELRFSYGAAVRRAADVWLRGCGAWLPVVALIAMARAREHVRRAGETRWDSERDCLVTHGPVGNLSLVTLAIGLAAATLVFAAHWMAPVHEMSERWRQGLTAVTERIESARAPAASPAADAPPPGVSRIDDVAPTTVPAAPPALAAVAPGPLPQTPPAPAPAPAAVPKVVPKAVPPPLPAPVAVLPRRLPSAPPPAAVEAAPALSPIELRDRRMALLSRQAQRQQAGGDFEGLAKTCQRWADEDWRNPRAFYCAGIGLQGIGRHKEAIAMFNKAGALVPRDDPLKNQIGDAVLRSFRAQTGN
ncbi:MAG: J domain-containing protein [Betaproteobacteria bacterium]|nr:J domain-containing protein [Betaproteobacteria bacterium]